MQCTVHNFSDFLVCACRCDEISYILKTESDRSANYKNEHTVDIIQFLILNCLLNLMRYRAYSMARFILFLFIIIADMMVDDEMGTMHQGVLHLHPSHGNSQHYF